MQRRQGKAETIPVPSFYHRASCVRALSQQPLSLDDLKTVWQTVFRSGKRGFISVSGILKRKLRKRGRGQATQTRTLDPVIPLKKTLGKSFLEFIVDPQRVFQRRWRRRGKREGVLEAIKDVPEWMDSNLEADAEEINEKHKALEREKDAEKEE